MNYILSMIIMAGSLSVMAQTNLHMRLAATAGITRIEATDYQNQLNMPRRALTLGAGSTIMINKFLVHTDFTFWEHTSSSTQSYLQHIGFDTSLGVGYEVIRAKRFSIEPMLAWSNQRMERTAGSVDFQDHWKTTSSSVTPSLALIVNNPNHTMFGLRAGLDVPLLASEWKSKLDDSDRIQSRLIGYKLSIVIGGIVPLKNN